MKNSVLGSELSFIPNCVGGFVLKIEMHFDLSPINQSIERTYYEESTVGKIAPRG